MAWPETYETIANGAQGDADHINTLRQITVGPRTYNALGHGGLAGNGSTAEQAALNSLITTVFNAGGGDIEFPGHRQYRFTGAVNCKAGVNFRWGQGAQILKDTGAGTNLFQLPNPGTFIAAEDKITLDADVAARSYTVTLPTGEGAAFSAGEWFGIESAAVVFHDANPREVAKILDVTGDVITLNRALQWDYLVADTAKAFKAPVVGPFISEGGEFVRASGTVTGYIFDLPWGAGVEIIEPTLDACGGGIQLRDTQGATITRPTIRGFGYADAFGYGITAHGCAFDIKIHHYTWRDGRHAFTTTTNASDAGRYFPMDILVSDSHGTAGPDGLTIWDTHEYAYRTTFKNCTGHGASVHPAFQVRAPRTTLDHCKGLHGFRGVSSQEHAADLAILGGEFAENHLTGLSISSPNARVIGAEVHHNGTQGQSGHEGVNIGTTGTGCQLKEAYIHDNANRGVRDQAGDLLIENCVIPHGGTVQTTGVSGLGATGQARFNTFSGAYSGGNALFGASATAIIADNIGWGTGSKTHDWPDLATATQQSTTVTVSGAVVGDQVDAVWMSVALSGTRLWGEVTAANTVTVYHRNDSGGNVNVASGTLSVRIRRG